jgi:hypothetical protein
VANQIGVKPMEESKITIEDSDKAKNEFTHREGIDDTLQAELDKADVLILPKRNFRPEVPLCFPERTGEIFKFLETEFAKMNKSIGLAVSDDEYKEIELHDFWIYLPTMYIQSQVVLPLIINLLSNWIYDKFAKHPAVKEEPKVKFSAIIETAKGNKEIKFEGDNKSFKQLMDKIEL